MTEEQREPSDFFLQMPRPCTPPEPSEDPCSALGKARLQKAVERVRVFCGSADDRGQWGGVEVYRSFFVAGQRRGQRGEKNLPRPATSRPPFSRYLLLFSSGKIQKIEIDSAKHPGAPVRSAEGPIQRREGSATGGPRFFAWP